MKEIQQSPEIPKKGAPIRLLLGTHDDVGIADLSHLDSTIGRYAGAAKKGYIFVPIESGFSSFTKASLIESHCASGISPSLSYSIGRFYELTGRIPDLSKKEHQIQMSAMLSKIDPFAREELRILDKHHHETGNIRILFEYVPEEELKVEKANSLQNETNKLIVTNNVTSGGFEYGLQLFKPVIENLASFARRRDERLAIRIAKIAEAETTAAIIGFRGGGHILLGNILAGIGYDIEAYRLKSETGIENNAISQKYLFPDIPIPELSWYKFMIGFTLEDIQYRGLYRDTRLKNITPQQIKTILNRLTDVESIAKLETTIRTKDFPQAILSLV